MSKLSRQNYRDRQREREREGQRETMCMGRGLGAGRRPAYERLLCAFQSGYDLKSWTGKTPQTHIIELCKKNGWLRPDFKVEPRQGGVQCRLFIRKRDPKGDGVETKHYGDRRTYVDGNEARNFVAVYALHSIAYHKGMHRILPPGYRDYWHELEQVMAP